MKHEKNEADHLRIQLKIPHYRPSTHLTKQNI